jgi:hypothetical protein
LGNEPLDLGVFGEFFELEHVLMDLCLRSVELWGIQAAWDLHTAQPVVDLTPAVQWSARSP